MSMTKMKKTVLSVCTLLMMSPSVLKAQGSTTSIKTPEKAKTEAAEPADSSTAPITTSPQSSSMHTASGTSVTRIEDVKTGNRPLSINLGMEMSERVAKDETTPKENTLSIVLEPVYKINSTFTASARIIINQDNYAQHDTTASDGTVSLSIKGYKFNDQFKTVHSLSSIIPASEKSTKTTRLQGSIATTNGIGYSGDYFTLIGKVGLTRYFHEFTQDADGSPNLQYRVSQILDLKIPMTDQFYLSALGNYRISWTYNNFERYSFIFDADLNYDFTDKFSINAGTSNDGNALKANGVESNLQAFNENTSVYRFGLSYSY